MEPDSRVIPSEHNKDFDHIRIVHDEDEPRMKSVNEIKETLSRIDWARSCVDMGWRWEVQRVFICSFNDVTMKDEFVHDGYRLRTTFRRPDRDSGEIGDGWGRWWEVSLDCTESAVVKTAFAAAKMILEHELMESLKWKGSRPFDPHHTIRELTSIQPARYTMSIP